MSQYPLTFPHEKRGTKFNVLNFSVKFTQISKLKFNVPKQHFVCWGASPRENPGDTLPADDVMNVLPLFSPMRSSAIFSFIYIFKVLVFFDLFGGGERFTQL